MRKLHFYLLVAAAICVASCKDSKPESDTPSDETKTEEVTPTKDEVTGNDMSTDTESADESTIAEEEMPVVAEPEEVEEPEGVVQVDQGKKVYVYSMASDGYTNIREEPTVKSKIVASLVNDGPGAVLLERADGWYKVNFKGIEGYVSSRIVAIGDEEGPLTATPKKKTVKTTDAQTVYYCVLGSWKSLEKAKEHYSYLPDALDLGRIYKCTIDGKTVYRMAFQCYRSKAQALKTVKMVRETFDRDAWIWESKGLGECIYCPIGYDGEPTKPLQPE